MKIYKYRTHMTPGNIATFEELGYFTKGGSTLYADTRIIGQYIRVLERLKKVEGDFGVTDSILESLGSMEEVTGNVYTSFYKIYPALNDLGNLEKVGGNVKLQDMSISNLGLLKYVGGYLNLRNTPIRDLGQLEFVGGNLYLPKQTEGKLDLSKVRVVGKIKYINDKKSQLDKIPKPDSRLLKSPYPVPYWKQDYDVIITETPEQKTFYDYFKAGFLEEKPIDIQGNSNYAFLLFRELKNSFRVHQSLDVLQHQLKMLGDFYPKTEPYAARFLEDAKEGKIEWNDVLILEIEPIKWEDYGISVKTNDDVDEDDGDEIEVVYVGDDDDEDENDEVVRTEIFLFPPKNRFIQLS